MAKRCQYMPLNITAENHIIVKHKVATKTASNQNELALAELLSSRLRRATFLPEEGLCNFAARRNFTKEGSLGRELSSVARLREHGETWVIYAANYNRRKLYNKKHKVATKTVSNQNEKALAELLSSRLRRATFLPEEGLCNFALRCVLFYANIPYNFTCGEKACNRGDIRDAADCISFRLNNFRLGINYL